MKQFEKLNKSQYLVFNLGCGGNVPNVVNSINLIVINVYKLLIKDIIFVIISYSLTNLNMGDESEAGPSQPRDGAAGGGGVDINQQLASLLGGFCVYPLSWCPHMESLPDKFPETVNVKEECGECRDASENWMCLNCNDILCSRYVRSHSLAHSSETGHSLALSFSDLSVWCYACDNYIDNPKFYDVKNAAHRDKFGEEMIKLNTMTMEMK